MSKSPSLRRIQADIRELAFDPSDRYSAAPLENDMFEWHFTIRGANDTDFQGGIYHGRILLPPDYPFKPPHIIFLTPTGRFDINTKICLSFSAYHPELWQPAWGIRLILEALISFLPTPADGAVGALDWSATERKQLALRSHKFSCPTCGPIQTLIPPVKPKSTATAAAATDSSTAAAASSSTLRFQKEIEELQRLQSISHAKKEGDDADVATKTASTEDVENDSAPKQEQSATNGNNGEEDRNDSTTTPTTPTTPPAVTNADSTTATANIMNVDTNNDDNYTSMNIQLKITADAIAAAATPTIMEEKEPPVDAAPAAVDDAAAVITTTNHNNTIVVENQDHPLLLVPPNTANNNYDTSLTTKFLDPFLQVIIVLLIIICYLLIQKIIALVNDINSLEKV